MDTDDLITAAFRDALAQYAEALQHLGTPLEIEQRAARAYAEYLDVVRETTVGEEVLRQVTDAFAAYTTVVSEAVTTESIRERFDAAYREYLRSVQKAWAAVDLDAIDAASLGEIGQHLQSVVLDGRSCQDPAGVMVRHHR